MLCIRGRFLSFLNNVGNRCDAGPSFLELQSRWQALVNFLLSEPPVGNLTTSAFTASSIFLF